MKNLLQVMLAVSIFASFAWAQSVAPSKVIYPKRVDTSPPLRELARPVPDFEPGALYEIPNPQPPKEGVVPEATGVDPVLQKTNGPNSAIPTLQNFEGLRNTDNPFLLSPPDPNFDVGPNHIVQMVNLIFAIWDKAGNLLAGPSLNNSLWSGFGGDCEFNNSGDPIVLYDEAADRWLLSQFAQPGGSGADQCIAISTTGDPTGSYFRYQFPTPGNDYPKLGVWTDAYNMVIRNFAGPFRLDAYGFERDKMLTGDPSAQAVVFNMTALHSGVNAAPGFLPADIDGAAPPAGTPGMILGHENAFNRYVMFELDHDWSNTANSSLTLLPFVNVASFDGGLCNFSRSCIPQPGTTRRVDGFGDAQMHRLAFRDFGSHFTLTTSHVVDVADFNNHAGMRWAELRNTGGNWFVEQQGTYSPDSDHRWLGSAAMNANGDIALGYSVSSSSTFPSIRFTGRVASDPPGIMSITESVIVDGSGSQTGSDRWGDYTAMAVDPADGETFWYTAQYVQNTGSVPWQTRIASFKLIPPPPPPPAVARINCGNGAYTTIGGVTFDGDQQYNPPSVTAGFFGGNLFQTNESIAGTADDKLYSDVHGVAEIGFSYLIDVPAAGDYDVVLHFAAPPFGPDKGIMDISAEGVLLFDDYAPEDIVGGWTAHTEPFTVNVTDGTLDLRFDVVNKAAFVSAIEVLETTTAPGLAKGQPDDRSAEVPTEFVLHQNHPNPFNPTTNIRFNLPADGTTTLKVYNMLGKEVKTLVDGYRSAGSHEIQWDARNEAGEKVSSGIYIYRIQSQGFSDFKKMTLLQ